MAKKKVKRRSPEIKVEVRDEELQSFLDNQTALFNKARKHRDRKAEFKGAVQNLKEQFGLTDVAIIASRDDGDGIEFEIQIEGDKRNIVLGALRLLNEAQD